MDESQQESSHQDSPKKDVHANVGFSITSTPDKTEMTRRAPAPLTSKAAFPFRIILVSDLAPNQTVSDWSKPGLLRSVDRNSFKEFAAAVAPSLSIQVRNRLSLTPARLDFSLTFRAMEDFTPSGLLKQIPSLAALTGIRELVNKVGSGSMAIPHLKSLLQDRGIDASWIESLINALSGKPSSRPAKIDRPSSTPSNPSLSNLFDMVDLGDGSQPPDDSPAALVDSLVTAAGTQEDRVDIASANSILDDVETRLAAQVSEILRDSEVRALEARWQSLKFLVDRLNFKAGIELDVLATNAGDLAAAVHYQIVLAEHAAAHGTPASLLVFDQEIRPETEDYELLREIAESAESIQTPAIISASENFFGDDASDHARGLPVIWQHLERPEYIGWKHYAESSAAPYVSLALPAFLLRNARTLNEAAVAGSENLWGRAAIAGAALIANRFAETGWPTGASTGQGQSQHRLEDLPVWESPKGMLPLRAIYNSEKAGELYDAGFMVLGGVRGKDFVYVQTASTTVARRTFEDDSLTRRAEELRSLDSQLFISRIVHFILREQANFSDEISAGDASAIMTSKLHSLMGLSGSESAAQFVSVYAVDDTTIDVSVEAPPSILPDPVGFRARIPVST